MEVVNAIVPIYITDDNNKLISMRDIHERLGSRKDFSSWAKSKIEKVNLIENIDYYKKATIIDGKRLIEYYITIKSASLILCTLRNTGVVKDILEFFKNYNTDANATKIEDVLEYNEEPFHKKMFMIALQEAFEPYGYKVINNYSVFKKQLIYIPDINLSIDYCDKEEVLNDVFGCRYIKVNSEKSHNYSLGFIFKVLLDSKVDEIVKPKVTLNLVNEEMEYKATAYDSFLNSEGLYSFDTVTKIIKMPRVANSNNIIGKNTLLVWLKRDGIILGNDRPYKKYIENNWFKVVPKKIDGKDDVVTLVTTKGIDGIYKKYRYNNMPTKVDYTLAEQNNS